MRDIADIFERDSKLRLAKPYATNNQYRYEILERLDAKVQLYRVTICLTPDKISEDVKQHREMLNAIFDGDVVRAREAMMDLAVVKT